MSDDRFTLMSPGQTRKASPPVPARTPPSGTSRDRALGNSFLAKPAYTTISMEFDGTDLIVYGDGTEVFRTSAQSGRPVVLREQDAKAAGANPVTDTYLNDKRFVGVKDYGPIPEGTYTFRPAGIERFDFGERMKLQLGGVFGAGDVTVQGRRIHAGDWGTGRIALTPGALRQGPFGDVTQRGGFFLHGGLLSGSSGCIDVGGDFDAIVDLLQGYTKPVTVTVRYRNEPPVVNFFQGTSGALAYGRARFQHGPSFGLGGEVGAGGPRALASGGYDLVLQWAGGALRAGVRLDVPFTDQAAFVRAGVGGGLDFRLFRPLYGRLVGGYGWDLTGPDPRHGPELGGGLRLDLGPTQWEALYQVLRPAADQDQQVHQALLKLGFRF
ncbi:hypothetical protein GA0070624_5124 [Micromonospora rhizosphaerae]|uniref:Uncharacterized protein n=1 Tax=Micromonospora rhizosphaerae TaxID=568872 RepID=A0A1C6SZI2_9ACTN|nr:hypothetical protein [Micromonospora rhizosphaerae]SCL34940.1 hypothetical protein GA0070624_5124 [Micromonospora rhizosphaerae]